jgi:hypothetical protein
MLRESLRALRKQKPFLESADEWTAFRTGMRHWRDYYGEREWRLLRRSLTRRGEMRRALHAGLCLFRYAPRVFVVQACKDVGRRLRLLAKTSVAAEMKSEHR